LWRWPRAGLSSREAWQAAPRAVSSTAAP
jgi:hypothetical protein